MASSKSEAVITDREAAAIAAAFAVVLAILALVAA